MSHSAPQLDREPETTAKSAAGPGNGDPAGTRIDAGVNHTANPRNARVSVCFINLVDYLVRAFVRSDGGSVSRSCLSSLLMPLVGAVLLATSPTLAQSSDTGRAEPKAAETRSKVQRAPAKLDLSTPHVPDRRVVTHGATQRSYDAAMKKQSLGSLDLGDGELRLDGGRKSRDMAHDVTGFDQTPGSATFRQLAPAQKSGTPPYVGFTFSRPNN